MKLDARRSVLLALLAVSIAYHGARTYLVASAMALPAAYPGPPFGVGSYAPTVRVVTEGAKTAGLQVGDRIERAGGRTVRGSADLAQAVVEAAPSGHLLVEVSREGGPAVLTLPFPAPRKLPGPRDLAGPAVIELLLPAFFLGVGFVVVWFKPSDRSAWLLLFMMQTFCNLVGLDAAELERLGPIFGTAAKAWLLFFGMSWSLAMLGFVFAFPEPFALDRRRPWLKWLVLGPLLGFSLIRSGTSLVTADYRLGAPIVALFQDTGRAGMLLTYVSMSVFFWTLSYKMTHSPNADAGRRLKILMAGAAFAMSPSAVIATLAVFTGRGFDSVAPEGVRLVAAVMMLIFPVTLAYVVIVHKAMGLGIAIRQGLQYALAQRAVRVIQVLIGFAVMWSLLDVLADPDNRRVDRIQWMAYGLLFMVFFQRGAHRFKQWIDRRFFREVVDAERILAELGENVRSIADRRDLLETVSRKIGEALHIPKVAAFVRGDGGFLPAFATGYGGDAVALEFGNAGVLTCCVAALQRPQTVYLDDDRSWVRRENIPESDAAKLRELQSEVLIPLRTKTSVEGFLSLGPKASEAAYSPSDLQLLQSVAHQTALALDNSRLVEQVASEIAKRERLTREIEIAREVQFTLLPQTPPTVSGLDLAGHCRPAAGVGGDYYDFVPLEGERSIGLAIGDIAGKGIPAALLMAGLQAALRGQALVGSRDLSRLMTNINKLIFESSPTNRYATFFYGEYRDRAFAYVNAGHNAPVLLRKDGRVERLEKGGPVVGLMAIAPFIEGSVDIQPGDVVLGYTDGVSECMNPEDEEWGEDKLIEVLKANRHLKASDIVALVIKAADAFAAGAKQHDDMTLIVVKAL